MQEMSYRENFFFRIARKNYLEKCLKQNRESEQIRGKAVSSRAEAIEAKTRDLISSPLFHCSQTSEPVQAEAGPWHSSRSIHQLNTHPCFCSSFCDG